MACADISTALPYVEDYQLSCYRVVRKLRKTLQGSVVIAESRHDGKLVALKSSLLRLSQSRRSRAGDRVLEDVFHEIAILRRIEDSPHPGLIHLDDAFVDADKVYLVLQLCKGGELYDDVERHGPMKEERARRIARQILLGIQHMHNVLGVCHLDISPENIFLDENDNAKIGDFGLAREFKDHLDDELEIEFHERPGKQQYMCPEIFQFQNFQGRKADVFSAGAMLFVMLFGFPPFDEASLNDFRFKMIARGRLVELLKHWDADREVSPMAVDLIQNMLKHEHKRLTLEEVLDHPWFVSELPVLD